MTGATPMSTSPAREWWTAHLGARPDPVGRWQVGPVRDERYGTCTGQVRKVQLDSYGATLNATWFRPDGATPGRLVIIPFYDTAPLFGQASARTALAGRDPARNAHGLRLAETGLSVLAVPWWFEQVAVTNSETAERSGLAARYSAAAARHQRELPMTGLGRSIADLMLAVSAVTAAQLVDPGGLGVFGHSLGAKLAGHLAALDPRIDAAVAHEAGWGWTNSNWEAPWYLDGDIPTARDHDELLGLVAPRPLLVTGGGDGDGPHNTALLARAAENWTDGGFDLLLHDGGHPAPPHVLAACASWLRRALA